MDNSIKGETNADLIKRIRKTRGDIVASVNGRDAAVMVAVKKSDLIEAIAELGRANVADFALFKLGDQMVLDRVDG